MPGRRLERLERRREARCRKKTRNSTPVPRRGCSYRRAASRRGTASLIKEAISRADKSFFLLARGAPSPFCRKRIWTMRSLRKPRIGSSSQPPPLCVCAQARSRQRFRASVRNPVAAESFGLCQAASSGSLCRRKFLFAFGPRLLHCRCASLLFRSPTAIPSPGSAGPQQGGRVGGTID